MISLTINHITIPKFYQEMAIQDYLKIFLLVEMKILI